MRILLIAITISLSVLSCNINQDTKDNKQSELSKPLNLTVNQLDSFLSTIKIDNYTLINSKEGKRQKDAADIIELKRKWPQVMQSPNRVGFDTILSKNFTFFGEGRLLNREEYIQDRLTTSDWKITFVKYDNVTLQFFDSIGLLTYRNQVTNENVKTNEIEIEYISWADIYVKEQGKWKIGASHTIDVRIEQVEKGPNR